MYIETHSCFLLKGRNLQYRYGSGLYRLNSCITIFMNSKIVFYADCMQMLHFTMHTLYATVRTTCVQGDILKYMHVVYKEQIKSSKICYNFIKDSITSVLALFIITS